MQMGRRVSFGPSSLWLVVGFCLFLGGIPARAETLTEDASEIAVEQTVSTSPKQIEKKKTGWFRTRCQRAIFAAVIVAATSVVPTVFHGTNAAIQGKQHLGRGIYLDMDAVNGALREDERAVLDEAHSSPYAATQLLVDKLHGDYGNWLFTPFALPSDATEYLKGTGGKDRGVCRHKACILAGVLDAKGVKAVLQSGTTYQTPYRWHVWVYLPELEMVADPTSGRIVPRDEYLKEFEIYMNGVPLAGGWY